MRAIRSTVHQPGSGRPGLDSFSKEFLAMMQEIRLQLASQQNQINEISRHTTGEINRLWAAVAGKDTSGLPMLRRPLRRKSCELCGGEQSGDWACDDVVG